VARGTHDYRCNGATWQRVPGDAGTIQDAGACGPCFFPDVSNPPFVEASVVDVHFVVRDGAVDE
jgi:hypothetical protein